jgi:anaerobic magnesium-protoporphyrin IX monomethyl ester cyclase
VKITLIAPTPLDISAFGVRALSAYLKAHGHQVRMILLPEGVERLKYRQDFVYRYNQKVLQEVAELCRGAELIGISLMTHYFDRSRQITEYLKKTLNVPVIWGGIHPTVRPEESLDYADMALVGEGEEALLELVEKMAAGRDIYEIRNIWFRKGTQIIRNQLRPLLQNLDQLPFYDFGMDDHYIYCNRDKQIKPLDKELLMHNFPREPALEGTFSDSYRRTISYKTMTSRGCPHHCTYCAERTLALMYKGERYLRFRSVEHVISELKWAKRELPFIESVFLFDDTFTARPLQDIRHFSQLYKKEINLPIHIQASPATTTPEKIEALIDAGLAFVEMGIQSVSQKGMTIYKREILPEKILQAANILHRYSSKIYPPCYHVILDNPWETTAEVLKTLDLVLSLPRPFWLKRASLVLFPGTELYDRAVHEGLIRNKEDERRLIYNKHLHTPEGSYVNFLMYLAGFSYFPRRLLRLLARPRLVGALEVDHPHKLFHNLQRLGDGLIVLYKGIHALLTGDFRRIRNFLEKDS